MPRIALGVSYQGANWLGWQTQPGGGTVQDAVDAALCRFLDTPIKTICAGRTDTGVHALGQVIHLDTNASRRDESWVRGLNALLPDSIAIQWAQPVANHFHARFSALSRTYFYLVRSHRVRSPLLHAQVGWVHRELDLNAMQQAAQFLIGQHDFSSFRSSQCQAASPIRSLTALDIHQQGDFFLFRFQANAFLHHMIRNLMGALIYIGQGKHAPAWVSELLAQGDRRLAAPTFSPAGLYLAGVDYPSEFGLVQPQPEAALFSQIGFTTDLATSGIS
ncbi:tRNA pseudouridine(38-40) synthase TruA [Alcaligenaceae bacterium]|nr:tRNA pseudouridine(38-40) synthase TruA [Alcaligenaceae bacterium]